MGAFLIGLALDPSTGAVQSAKYSDFLLRVIKAVDIKHYVVELDSK
jgi:hypothetical protein